MFHKPIPLYEGRPQIVLRPYLQDQYLNQHQSLDGDQQRSQPQPTDEDCASLRPAVIILPGGGFQGYLESEGEPVAIAFSALGYQSFVLSYGIGQDARMPGPLLDTARAVQLVKAQGPRWGIDPERVYLVAFGTAAWLAALLADGWQGLDCFKALGVNYTQSSIRPAGVVLIQPMLDLTEACHQLLEKGDVGRYQGEALMQSLVGWGPVSESALAYYGLERWSDWPSTWIYRSPSFSLQTEKSINKVVAELGQGGVQCCLMDYLGEPDLPWAIKLATELK